MKAFTDVEQSKKLAEILPIESADMYWFNRHIDLTETKYEAFVVNKSNKYIDFFNSYAVAVDDDEIIPCWSLAALLDILYPNITLDHTEGEGWSIITNIVEENPNSILQDIITEKVIAETPIDACVEMIYKLKEKDLL